MITRVVIMGEDALGEPKVLAETPVPHKMMVKRFIAPEKVMYLTGFEGSAEEAMAAAIEEAKRQAGRE